MNKEGKIWGSTSKLFEANNVAIHRAVIKQGFQCSKHLHPHSYNMFFIESGIIKVLRWKNDYDLVDETLLYMGESCVIPPGEFHRFIGHAAESVIYEVYWASLNTSDIVREDCGGSV